MKTLWQVKYELDPVDLGNDFYMVRFYSKAEYKKVLTGGPWIIMGHYLMVQKWRPDFQPRTAHISSMVAWVHFPNLPIDLFNLEVLYQLGSLIGKVVRVDKNTEHSIRGKFARIGIEIELAKPLLQLVCINGQPQVVEYEGLHLICFGFGTYGHRQETSGRGQDQTKEKQGTVERSSHDNNAQ
ncbi:hypothetical protein BUALT_Bualt11G0026600 [Buddleja alternifolia]|uniref:DUF4283 domain-containing protein n=1 Tax=Buddleja alternifolia TaxID=168488 RepID=A0AAV6WWY3_9LAMI|nr:hypothetical protein BUALT_Bualt11G0026600 [Buddleja alternifolia]